MGQTRALPNYLILGAVAVATLAVGYWLFGVRAPVDVDAQLRASDLADKQRERSEKVLVARAAQQRAADTGTRALELLEVSLKEQARWTDEVEPLLVNQQGRVLAGDDVLVQGFIAVYDEKRPSRAELEAARPRVEALMSEPKSALADPLSAYQPTDALVAELERERAALERAASAYKAAREKVESLLAAAKQKGVAPGGIPLEQAIRELAARDTLLSASAESARKERQRVEEEQKQATLDEQLHRERLRAMEAQAEQDRLALAAKAETEQRVRQVQAERERLVLLANDPAVQARFAPFLTPAHFGLGCGFGGPCRYDEKSPESFGMLQRLKVFEDYKALARAASRTHPANDRPKWKVPSTDAEWAVVKENFELFSQLAPIWVEQGRLGR